MASARFESEAKFSWALFDGYNRIRILTYSAGVGAIVRLLDRHGFREFECVFSSEGTLRTLKDIMAFQQVATSATRAAITRLPDERHIPILSRVREGQVRFCATGLRELIQSPCLISKVAMAIPWTYNLADCK